MASIKDKIPEKSPIPTWVFGAIITIAVVIIAIVSLTNNSKNTSDTSQPNSSNYDNQAQQGTSDQNQVTAIDQVIIEEAKKINYTPSASTITSIKNRFTESEIREGFFFGSVSEGVVKFKSNGKILRIHL